MQLFDRGGDDSWTVAAVRELGWRELEMMMGAALSEKGYNVEVTQPVKDGGVDVDAERIEFLKSLLFRPKLVPRRERLIIDAKQWSAPVGANPVEEIAETADTKGGTGVIAAPSGFHQSARQTAEGRGVRLYDGQQIVSLFDSVGLENEEVSG